MVDVTKIGRSTWAVIVSSSYSGAAGSEVPAGDIYYFDVRTVKDNLKPLDRFGNAGLGLNTRYPTGKRGITVRVTGAHVPAEVLATSTQEMDEFTDFVYNSSIKQGANKVYLFIRHVADARYRKLSWNTSHVHLQYVKGQFADNTNILEEEDYIWQTDFVFKEATVP